MYADMVRYADLLIGRIVEELERLKLRDNTLVFVATDNGTESSLAARRNGRMVQGGLYQLTEAGGNVGLVVNSPRLVPGGRSAPLADFSDLLPTICDLAGVASPADRVIDGRSLADLIRGRPGASSPRQWIFNQYHTRRVVRDQRYKLYSTGQFYDLAADPEERHNLVETDPPAVSAARNRLADVLASLPPDTPPPFPLRSQSAFKLGAEGVR
jgi:arylsulfatase A